MYTSPRIYRYIEYLSLDQKIALNTVKELAPLYFVGESSGQTNEANYTTDFNNITNAVQSKSFDLQVYLTNLILQSSALTMPLRLSTNSPSFTVKLIARILESRTRVLSSSLCDIRHGTANQLLAAGNDHRRPPIPTSFSTPLTIASFLVS